VGKLLTVSSTVLAVMNRIRNLLSTLFVQSVVIASFSRFFRARSYASSGMSL
jgi:hypothetical protein